MTNPLDDATSTVDLSNQICLHQVSTAYGVKVRREPPSSRLSFPLRTYQSRFLVTVWTLALFLLST